MMDSDITSIDCQLYKAAAEGQIDPFNSYTEPLNLLLTPTKNTILHIHIIQQPEGANASISFTEQILAKCPSLLLQTNNRGETPLHMAARHGHDTLVHCLIDAAKAKHQDIETGPGTAKFMLRMENIDKETALHGAVRHNNPSVVQILTEEDPDFMYSANRLGETPLYLAVERQYTKMAVQILDTCSSPDFSGPNGRTALHEAVIRNSSVMTTKILEEKETLAKEVDQQGWTPLHHASHFGHQSIVALLLLYDKSAAYIGDRDGRIPLHLASARGNSHLAVVFLIMTYCPDCHELVDHKGRNVLHFAAQSNTELSSLLEGINKTFLYVPSLKNLINQKDVDGNTPLHLLATYCFDITSLIQHPLVDKMAVNNDNSTPLDIVSKSTDDHISGTKGYTLKSMKQGGGYEQSLRNLIELKDTPPKRIETEEMERTKTSQIIVAALIVTVTFTAGFTMPGGYDSDKGTAILSRKGAFVAFIIADALAFILSTCALLFFYILEFDEVPKRRKQYLLDFAGLFLLLSIFLMLIAFTAAVFAVLLSTYLKVIICVITSFFVLICYSPLKQIFS